MDDKNAEAAAVSASPVPAEPAPPPAQPREIEVKFQLPPGAAARLFSAPVLAGAAPGPARELTSTYFDTAERDLRRHGMTLRVRRKGRAMPVMGLKWASGSAEDLFARGEIEVRCPGGTPAVELFAPAIRDRLAAVIGGRRLEPLFETRVKRRSAVVSHGRSQVEAALDEGVITAGEARMALSELELELKDGNPHDLLALASALSRDCGLSLAFEPKSGRGHRLAEGLAPEAQRAVKLVLPETATFDDLVAAVLSNTLAHFAANWSSLRETDAPESIHQLRVALRRMRSALGVFRKTIRLSELEDIRAEAKRIASALGPARECDAFRQNALSGPFRHNPERLKGVAPLLDAVAARRAACYAGARGLLDDPATSLFVLTVQSFIARRAWRMALPPEELGLLTSPARGYAASVLDELLRRALKRGKRLPDMPDEERHELRIALKNLRYACEFFTSLFGQGKEARAFLRGVAELQEDLGAHNDAATAQAFLEGLDVPPGAGTLFASGYLLGWYRHASVVADEQLMKKWKAFKRAPAFWE